MIISISEVTLQLFPEAVKANRANVTNIVVTPGVGASGQVVLGNLDAEGEFIPAHAGYYTVALTPEQFAAWGQDDGYAVACVLANLGLTAA